MPVGFEEGGPVVEVLDALEPADREVLLLRFTSDLELQEIADVLGLKLSAAKMRYYRALERFKTRYHEYLSTSHDA